MKIFLITGKKRTGKDTLADVICRVSARGVKYSFATPMKDVAKFLFPWSNADIAENKELVDPNFGISPRQFLQVFGTDFMQHLLSNAFPEYKEKTGRNFWAKKMVHTIKNYLDEGRWEEPIVIAVPDLRFPHEVEVLREAFGDAVSVIRVVRPEYYTPDQHSSEQEMDDIVADYTITNTGTLQEYQDLCRDFCKTIEIKTNEMIYIAGPITGIPDNNKDAFYKVSEKFRKMGYIVVSPLEVWGCGDHTWEEYMKMDIPLLVRCNKVYMLKNWQKSKGAALEHTIALNLNIDIEYEEDAE